TRSATTRKAPPATSERGITARLEVPTRRRTVCGTMMPTKPMRPLTDTAAAVASEAATTTVIRMRSTGRPRLAASSSPTARTSRARRCIFFQAEDGIRDGHVTGVQTCALPIYDRRGLAYALVGLAGVSLAAG